MDGSEWQRNKYKDIVHGRDLYLYIVYFQEYFTVLVNTRNFCTWKYSSTEFSLCCVLSVMSTLLSINNWDCKDQQYLDKLNISHSLRGKKSLSFIRQLHSLTSRAPEPRRDQRACAQRNPEEQLATAHMCTSQLLIQVPVLQRIHTHMHTLQFKHLVPKRLPITAIGIHAWAGNWLEDLQSHFQFYYSLSF